MLLGLLLPLAAVANIHSDGLSLCSEKQGDHCMRIGHRTFGGKSYAFSSSCSHMYCISVGGITRVLHHSAEHYGHHHICKHGMHYTSKCGCECFDETGTTGVKHQPNTCDNCAVLWYLIWHVVEQRATITSWMCFLQTPSTQPQCKTMRGITVRPFQVTCISAMTDTLEPQ